MLLHLTTKRGYTIMLTQNPAGFWEVRIALDHRPGLIPPDVIAEIQRAIAEVLSTPR